MTTLTIQRDFNSATISKSSTIQQIVYVLNEEDVERVENVTDENNNKIGLKQGAKEKYKWDIIWFNVVVACMIHILGLYGLFLLPIARIETIYLMFVCITLAQIGSQAGAHRFWSHRSFKANAGVRWFLSICHVMAFQKNAFEWARDHRVHHKYAETDADPHNSNRGFFFSHIGWALVRKQPELIEKGKQLNLKDLYDDEVLMAHRRHYYKLATVFHLLLPTLIPVYLWGENWWIAFVICVMTRHAYTLNMTFLINSWAHMFGNRQYDKRIAPVECSIRHWLFGEGFHNFHHAFPWDYSASELGALDVFNPATAAIDFFHLMGWAWDLKKVKPEMVTSRKNKTGDTTMYYKKNRSLLEWSGGLFTVFGPFLIIRYVSMYFGY